MNLSIKEGIFKTLSYFDIFDFPLTLIELHRYLYKTDVSLKDLINELEESNIPSTNGLYHLEQRSNIVITRNIRYRLAEGKYNKVLKISKLLSRCSDVLFIGVCNSLAHSNATKDSDIDLFIITKPNSMWRCRAYTVGILKLLNKRPSPQLSKDKICLSFFLDYNNLNIKNIELKPYDIYLAYWIAQIYPIYDTLDCYKKFCDANSWIKEYIPNIKSIIPNQKRVISKPLWRFPILITDSFCKKQQLRIMPNVIKESKEGINIVINEQMLKFHVNDRRVYYRNEFERKICELKI